jgi:predicted NAD/FAD-binding protein
MPLTTRNFSRITKKILGRGNDSKELAASPVEPPSTPAGEKKKVAIIGGGTGGVAAAHFLQGSCEVDLFERRKKVGGNCSSVEVEQGGGAPKLQIDTGAQFFHPETHPIYTSLLERAGIFNPDDEEHDKTLRAAGSVCIFPESDDGKMGKPLFTSTHFWRTPLTAAQFGIFTHHARKAVLKDLSWEVTMEDWLKGLPLTKKMRDGMLLPWIAALIGTNVKDTARSSARSILQTFALAFPANLVGGATTYNSEVGLDGNLAAVLELNPGAKLHTDAEIKAVDYDEAAGSWTITSETGEKSGPFDAVVFNAAPRFSKELLRDKPWAKETVDLLERYEYFDAKVAIHTDPTYVHPKKCNKSVYNAQIYKGECEGSVWLGGIHTTQGANGGPVEVYKSWVTARSKPPEQLIKEREFVHPLITPDVVRAARELDQHQGMNGLYFSGTYTTGMDLQEGATYSAMKLAERLAPQSPTLAALRSTMKERGRDKVNYDL